MAESPIERRRRLEREKARKARLQKAKEAEQKRKATEAASKYVGPRAAPRTQKVAGFGYGAMGTAPKAKAKGDRSAISGTVAAAKAAKVAPKEPNKPTGGTKTGVTGTGRSAAAATAGGGQKKPTVSQSRTMWVKAGETVGGKVVKKGYLAQYGKPEKKVSARVEMVTGPKKGKVVDYAKGRKSKGGK